MLAHYTPAETLMLIEPDKTTLKVLLLLTFLDLRLKKVLDVAWLNKKSAQGGNAWGPHVQYGERFLDYPAKPHEKVFYEPLASFSEPSMPLGRLLREARKMAVSPEAYLENHFLQDSFFAKNFTAHSGSFPLSIAGNKTGKLLYGEIRLLNELAPGFLNDSPQEIAEILLTIGGNIFLLNMVPQEKIEAFGGWLGRDRSLSYTEGGWQFDFTNKQKASNPFHDLQHLSMVFYREFEHSQH